MTPPNDFDDLRGFDLSKLELDEIELDIERPPNPAWRWLAGLTLLGLIGGAIFYGERLRAMSDSGWGFGLSLLAIVIGIAFGRWVWSAAMARAAEEPDLPPEEPEGPPSAGLRWFTFLLGAGGAGALVLAVRSGALTAWFGDQAVFVSGAGALFIGIVLSRWLTMQAEAAKARDEAAEEDDAPFELPPWFKWVSFTVIVGAAVLLFVTNLLSAGGFDFSLGGAGFLVGLAAAIWLARRFDDLERQAREARRSPRT